MGVTLRRLQREGARLWCAARKYDVNLPFALRRFWRLYARELFSPDEIFLLGLIDPRLTDDQLRTFVSKERMLRLHQKVNPASHMYLTEDKIAFHRRCRDNHLASPRVLAVYSPRKTREIEWPLLTSSADWARFHRDNAVERVILKPVHGVHGKGVLRLKRLPGPSPLFEDQDGTTYQGAELLARMSSTGYDEWLVEECVEGHPALRDLSGTEALQTARVVTFVDHKGHSHVLASWLRIIGGNPSVFDNFNFGASGNLLARLHPGTGILEQAFAADSDGLGMVPVATHPNTGRSFSDFRVPAWQTVRQLVRSAALCFRPLKTVGWDVAITLKDPLLIEGNVTWDPLPGNPRIAEIYRRIEDDASRC